MCWIKHQVLLTLLFSLFNGVSAMVNPDVIGMAVAGCVSFVMICVIIAYLFLTFGWPQWIDHWMHQRGKVRMPKDYFKKKDEIKKKLLNGSIHSADRGPDKVLANGQPKPQDNIILQPGESMNPRLPSKKMSWTSGWTQRPPSYANKLYEEKDATIILGEEELDDVEFKIETILVDDEHLDVGPYKKDHSKEMPINGDVYNEPYLYSSVNTLTKKLSKNKQDPKESEPKYEVTEMIDLKGDLPLDSSIKVNHYDETLIHL